MSEDGDEKSKIRDDAKGAMAPSQADAKNNGVHSAHADAGGRDATRKRDDQSSPTTPVTGSVPKPA